jgi:hypothetical protein
MADEKPVPYKESDDHVPASTDVVDQLSTTGLGGTSKLTDVTPIFTETAKRDLVEASDALKDVRDPLAPSNVILPEDPVQRDRAVEDLHKAADVYREEGVVGPTQQQAAAFEAGAGPAGGDAPRTPATTGPGDAGSTFSGATGRPSDADTQATGPTAGSELAGSEKVEPYDLSSSSTASEPGSTDSGDASTSSTSAKPEINEDPSKYGLDEIQAYLDAHPEQLDTVKRLEREGAEGGGAPKKRSGVLNYTPKPKS